MLSMLSTWEVPDRQALQVKLKHIVLLACRTLACSAVPDNCFLSGSRLAACIVSGSRLVACSCPPDHVGHGPGVSWHCLPRPHRVTRQHTHAVWEADSRGAQHKVTVADQVGDTCGTMHNAQCSMHERNRRSAGRYSQAIIREHFGPWYANTAAHCGLGDAHCTSCQQHVQVCASMQDAEV
jgi:hypothetical protein